MAINWKNKHPFAQMVTRLINCIDTVCEAAVESGEQYAVISYLCDLFVEYAGDEIAYNKFKELIDDLQYGGNHGSN